MKKLTLLAMLAGAAAAPFFPALAQNAPGPDTLVVAQSAPIDTLDPADASARPVTNVLQHVFGTLYEASPDGKLEPYLAESNTISDDGKSITFRLRKGLTCHDGEALTAEDVAYSFKRAADPAMKFTGNIPGFVFSTIGFQDAVVVDPETVTIKIAAYNPIILGMVAEVYIHCKDSYEKMSRDQAAAKPVGSGPYRFVEWIRDDRVVIERNEGFALRAAPFKRVVWRTIPEASTRAAELIAGSVDLITNVVPDQIGRVKASASARVEAVAGTRRIYIGFNQKEKFGNTPGGLAIRKPEVRNALQYAVDIPTICETLLQTKCERATSLVNPPNHNKSLTPYPFDPKKAEALLDQAGYPRGRDGVRFSLKLQTPNGRYLNDANVALAIGQYLTDVGVKVDVEPLEWASVFVPLIRNHDAGPLFLLGTGGATWNALYDMSDLAKPDSGSNYTEWKDPEWFAAWDFFKQKRSDDEQRIQIDKMLKIFYERGPWLLMYFQPDFYGVSNRIEWTPRRDEHIYLYDAKRRS